MTCKRVGTACPVLAFLIGSGMAFGQEGVLLEDLSPPAAPAAAKAASEAPQTMRIFVTPAAEPEPALKYTLTPRYLELTPGNSVPYFYRAVLRVKSIPREFWQEHPDYTEWLGVPLDEFPKEEARKVVNAGQGALEELRTAVFREDTDWGWQHRELTGFGTISFLLDETQESRQLARLLALRARLEIAEGKLDEAIETLAMGYQLARNIGEQPFIISRLVGIAIGSMMNAQLMDLIDAPGSPNMYWALAELPDPLVDMRGALQYEMHLPVQMFPWLKDPETAQRTPEEWARLLTQAFVDMQSLEGRPAEQQPEWQARLAATAMIMAAYPEAKRSLLESGWPEEKLKDMPAAQVVAIQQARTYQDIYHEMFKWTFLPYAAAREGLDTAAEKLAEIRSGTGAAAQAVAFVQTLMPAARQALAAEARLESRLAAIQAVEAIRMHAAESGEFPESLEQVTVVPVPPNPLTGRAFPYRREEAIAVLEVPPPEGQPPQMGWRLEMTLEK